MRVGDFEPQPGSPQQLRDAAVRPVLERLGLRFVYKYYRAPNGSGLWSRQQHDLGGPFQLLMPHGLYDVYEVERDGVVITFAQFAAGDVDDRDEGSAAIVTYPSRSIPTFTAAPHGLGRGGMAGVGLTFPTHPQLEKTHAIVGEADTRRVLTGPVLDLLTREPHWALEGKGNSLVIRDTRSARDGSGFLASDEIIEFVQSAFRIAHITSP
jgi:hypothetical protein